MCKLHFWTQLYNIIQNKLWKCVRSRALFIWKLLSHTWRKKVWQCRIDDPHLLPNGSKHTSDVCWPSWLYYSFDKLVWVLEQMPQNKILPEIWSETLIWNSVPIDKYCTRSGAEQVGLEGKAGLAGNEWR